MIESRPFLTRRPKPPAPPSKAVRFVSGLDLGQAADPSALVVVEQSVAADDKGRHVPQYAVRHLERFLLGTPYPQIVAAVKSIFARPPLAGSHLVIDRTGVGRPVFDLFRDSGIRAAVTGQTITAGQHPGHGTVPKKDLVGAVQAVLGTRRIRIDPRLQLAGVLRKELESFRSKVTPDRNETFAAWREGDHDDCVLALALAVWTGERMGLPGPTSRPGVWTPTGRG